MKIGLRIDVDTFRGTRFGVPNLYRLLATYSMNASFFFSVGPDNMGRHLWRLLRPVFLWKMLRTRAANLYGWDILLRGTFWSGPIIGERLGSIIRSTFEAGHEIGLHAWDHHAWQAHINDMSADDLYDELKKGYDLLAKILGKPPTCSAVPGWKCNEAVLLAKSRFPFDYNSDCRGKSIFRPIAGDCELLQPQVPVTLPTYDEVVGRNGVTDSNYNDYMLSLLDPAKLNVLTVHAEVEGIACLEMFGQFVRKACSKDFSFVPLRVLLEEYPQSDPAAIVAREIPGRQGWICCQSDLSSIDVLSRT
ncbi:MAG TPA: 4-deoxy-4-formamido-L-arabinose-phosphoundecaprenol deformylase [Sedimentisphaerales bacterium]|nr:4-deoxy-4-formamido-L-arabinose-phosphoundecaprenol deformylase [Sedimentisphaerales bacterium]